VLAAQGEGGVMFIIGAHGDWQVCVGGDSILFQGGSHVVGRLHCGQGRDRGNHLLGPVGEQLHVHMRELVWGTGEGGGLILLYRSTLEQCFPVLWRVTLGGWCPVVLVAGIGGSRLRAWGPDCGTMSYILVGLLWGWSRVQQGGRLWE
jgi:hypothetical protein